MLKSLTAPLLSFLLLGAANAETIDVPAEKSGEILNTPLNGKNSVRCSFTIDKTYQSDTWGSSTAVHLLNEANEQVASLTAIFARDDLSPKNSTMTLMRFPFNLPQRKSHHEKTI